MYTAEEYGLPPQLQARYRSHTPRIVAYLYDVYINPGWENLLSQLEIDLQKARSALSTQRTKLYPLESSGR
jgi:hypothetical protein